MLVFHTPMKVSHEAVIRRLPCRSDATLDTGEVCRCSDARVIGVPSWASGTRTSRTVQSCEAEAIKRSSPTQQTDVTGAVCPTIVCIGSCDASKTRTFESYEPARTFLGIEAVLGLTETVAWEKSAYVGYRHDTDDIQSSWETVAIRCGGIKLSMYSIWSVSSCAVRGQHNRPSR